MTSFDEFKFFTGVKEIGARSFYLCSRLKSIIFPDSIIKTSSRDAYLEGAFRGCTNLTNVILNNGLTILSDSTFMDTAIENIKLPPSITQIRSCVFRSSNIKSLELHEGLEYFGGNILGNTYARKLVIPNSVKTVGGGIGNSLGNKNKNVETAIVVIGTGVVKFEGCEFFRDCNAKSKLLYLKASTPPLLPSTVYPNTNAIFVPKGTSDAYKSAPNWSSFANIIQEYDFDINPDNV